MKKRYFRVDRKNKTIKILRPITAIHFHRLLQDMLDRAFFAGNDELDITDPTITNRISDKEIIVVNGWRIINKRDITKGIVEYERNIRTRNG